MAKKGKPEKPDPKADKNAKDKTKDKKDKKDKKEAPEEPKPTRGLNLSENFGWTGKLPMTLVYEHCQRNKWNKPIIDIHKPHGKVKAIINLSWENPKTKELIKIPYNNGKVVTTINEAKHYAATYTLFKLSFNKNLKLLLPNIFKDYWDELTQERLELLKVDKVRHDVLYTDSPFQVYLQQQELKVQIQKEKDKARRERTEREAKTGTGSIDFKQVQSVLNRDSDRNNGPKRPENGPKAANGPNTANGAKKPENGTKKPENGTKKPENGAKKLESEAKGAESTPPAFISKKAWETAPTFDIDSETRIALENKLKYYINWHLTNDNTSTDISSTDKKALFTNLGFKPNHVEEAFHYTTSINGVLEWLLFYIPEDDLPPFFNRSNYSSLMQVKISKPYHHELVINNLTNSGYPLTDVLETLKTCDYAEKQATINLTKAIANASASGTEEFTPVTPEESIEIWQNEISSLQAMEYNFESHSDPDIVTLKLPKLDTKFKLFKPANYPNEMVGIQLISKLPNYIKLSIITKLVTELVTSQFLGFEYLFNIIDYSVHNWKTMVTNPGLLINSKLFKTESPLFKLDKTSQKASETSMASSSGFNLRTDVQQIKSHYEARVKDPKFAESLKARMKLPSWSKRDEILTTINDNQVVLITGETGSGKSTQIVQYILDQAHKRGTVDSKIMITQPRRISTLGLADRISAERITQVGKEIGYIIRGDNKVSSSTSVYFVTIGVLLRFLQTSKKVLNNLHYLIIDEVHERSVDSDFLLILLKQLLSAPNFSHLKIILMSATIDTSIFPKFFKKQIPHIHIPGRTFPITDVYLPNILTELDYKMEVNDQLISPQPDSYFFKTGNINYDLIVKLIDYLIDTKVKELHGSILVFMPGVFEITKLINAVLDGSDDILCHPLHSGLSPADQLKVFKDPPKGKVKVIVSTNIAETSITIPDCTIVIDTGRVKMVSYDPPSKSTRLIETWCSKSEMLQRRGRSGRIKSGTCYHLYTEETRDSWLINPIPEILRTNLDNLYLIIKSMGVSKVKTFLLSGLDSPSEMSLSNCEDNLKTIGALSGSDLELTSLGKYLSYLPTDLSNGKLLIYGCIFGCVDNCLLISSIKSIGSGSIFVKNVSLRDKFKATLSTYSNGHGDLIGYMNLIKQYLSIETRPQKNQFIKNNNLSRLVLNDILATRDQFAGLLKEMNFIPNKMNASLNRNDSNIKVLKALITSALYPKVCKINYPNTKYASSTHGAIEVNPDDRLIKYFVKNKNPEPPENFPVSRVFVHPSSTLFRFNKDGSEDSKAYNPDLTPQISELRSKPPFAVYADSVHTTKPYVTEVTPVNPTSILLFGGDISYNLGHTVGKLSPGIVMDNWIPIKTWCKNAVLVKCLRFLLDQILDIKLSKPKEGGDVDEILYIVEELINASI